jgi:hypothetical protein
MPASQPATKPTTSQAMMPMMSASQIDGVRPAEANRQTADL